MRVTFEVAFQALPPSLHRHCTDEAQKAETVLSAVIYIYIYIYIFVFFLLGLGFLFFFLSFFFGQLEEQSLGTLSSSLLVFSP